MGLGIPVLKMDLRFQRNKDIVNFAQGGNQGSRSGADDKSPQDYEETPTIEVEKRGMHQPESD